MELKITDSTWVADGTKVLRVDAAYCKAQAGEHRGNPLVEALPPYLQSDEPLKYFASYPECHEWERRESQAYRISAIRRIRNFHETMSWDQAVMKDIFRTVWGSYDHRNPLVNRAVAVQTLYEAIQKGRMSAQPLAPMEPAHASMIGLVGASGMGKSTVVRRTLSFLPQVINHPVHGFRQLVWIHVQCPPNGELNQLLLWLLRHIDNLLGTNYVSMLKGRFGTYTDRVDLLARLLRKYYVGILVLDEAHYVFQKNTREIYLNFITNITNGGETAIMHVGLPSALEAFFRNMYTARRATDGDLRTLEPNMSRADWNRYLEGLLQYQWTRELATVGEIGSTLELLTGRIPALSSRLFELAQVRAVSSRSAKKVTDTILLDVAKRYFKPVQDCLAMLREERHIDLTRYDAELRKAIDRLEEEIDARTTSASKTIDPGRMRRAWHPMLKRACLQLADLGEDPASGIPKLVALINVNPGATLEWLVESYLRDSLAPESEPTLPGPPDAKPAAQMKATRDAVRTNATRGA
jgi:hypothetical protein